MKNINVKDICKTFLYAVFLPQLVAFLLIMVFSLFFENLESLQNSYLYIFSMYITSQACFFLIYLMFNKKHENGILTEIKDVKNKVNVKNVLFCAVISIIAVFGLMYFVGMFDLIFEQFGYTDSSMALPLDTFGWFLVNVLLSAVLPAIMEELVFRKVIFKGLRKYGFWISAILSSVMFMIVHQSLSSIVYPLIMGIVFCLVVEKTGSVLYSMIIHFCNNFIVILIEYLSIISGKNLLPAISLWWEYLIATIVAIIAVLSIFFIVRKILVKKCDMEANDQDIQPNQITAENLEKVNIERVSNAKTIVYTLLIAFAYWLIIVLTSLS